MTTRSLSNQVAKIKCDRRISADSLRPYDHMPVCHKRTLTALRGSCAPVPSSCQQQQVCLFNFRYSGRMNYVALAQVLILLSLANGSPVIAKRIFGANYAAPVDGNARFIDGRPLIGPSKTIRGIVVSLVVTAL